MVKRFFLRFQLGKNRFCTFLLAQNGVCARYVPPSRDMVDGFTFLPFLFPIINVRRRKPRDVDGGQTRKKRRDQINDSFTCSHCKIDGFDAIASAKNAG